MGYHELGLALILQPPYVCFLDPPLPGWGGDSSISSYYLFKHLWVKYLLLKKKSHVWNKHYTRSSVKINSF